MTIKQLTSFVIGQQFSLISIIIITIVVYKKMSTKKLLQIAVLAFINTMIASCVLNDEKSKEDSQELYRVRVGDKCGFINENGKIIIEPQFDDAYYFFGDGVCFAISGNRKGLINAEGKFVAELDTAINWTYRFEHGVTVCKANNYKLKGIINKSGEIILPAIYRNIVSDGDNGFIVEDTLGNQGYVNNQGDFVIPCKYSKVGGFSEGLIPVEAGKKYGYVDTNGIWVIDTIYDEARHFGNGFARVKTDGKWHFINHDGNRVERFKCDEILTGFNCNRAFVKNGNALELIDTLGTKIAEVKADSVWGFSDGFGGFKINGKVGFLDTLGIAVLRPKYEKLSVPDNGLCIFENNGKKGLVTISGDVVFDAIYEEITIEESLILSRYYENGQNCCTYYDKKGNLIWKDIVEDKFSWPEKPTKKDFISYFDSRLSELDPIEGIYYVTFNRIAVDRENNHSTSNGSSSNFIAVGRDKERNEFTAFFIDEDNPWRSWRKKFVQIGESNAYAIMDYIKEETSWAEDGKIILENPYEFEATLRQGGNNYYNWYVKCEFIKDYPSPEIYEQVQKAEWSGTGFAIADGFIVTNYHVANGAKTIKIRGVDGKMDEAYKGFVAATDKEHDLAIIKIVDKNYEGFGNIPYCIGKSIPEVGDDVFVLGYPLTSTMGQEIKLTDGIISAASGYKGDQSMYQISAAVQPGNSGGPLFDKNGNVIGIICAKHADAENANYAIKVSYLFSLANNSGLGIKLPSDNRVKSKSLAKKVKQVQPFVYLIECSSR